MMMRKVCFTTQICLVFSFLITSSSSFLFFPIAELRPPNVGQGTITSIHPSTTIHNTKQTSASFIRRIPTVTSTRFQTRNSSHKNSNEESSVTTSDSDRDTEILANLTPQLRKMTEAFAKIPDEKTRYKQLLYMANQLPRMDTSLFTAENKVPGCLSTVYVDCTSSTLSSSSSSSPDDMGESKVILHYTGESDGLLTKGLVALLVKGLSGCTPQEILKVDPEFIRISKISQSLTPGRNNGFLNMLAVMKKKAQMILERDPSSLHSSSLSSSMNSDQENNSMATSSSISSTIVTSFEEHANKPMYNTIMKTLITSLKPTKIVLLDQSDQHAGHAGSRGWEESGESHFALEVVADAFEGLTLVKRHQLIYLLLNQVMTQIHALQISAKTPNEDTNRS